MASTIFDGINIILMVSISWRWCQCHQGGINTISMALIPSPVPPPQQSTDNQRTPFCRSSNQWRHRSIARAFRSLLPRIPTTIAIHWWSEDAFFAQMSMWHCCDFLWVSQACWDNKTATHNCPGSFGISFCRVVCIIAALNWCRGVKETFWPSCSVKMTCRCNHLAQLKRWGTFLQKRGCRQRHTHDETLLSRVRLWWLTWW